MITTARTLEPGQVAPPAGEFRHLFLADRDLFARRAERLRHLAKGHPLHDYLTFLALLADAQQKALDRFPLLPSPSLQEQEICREHGTPPLDACSRPRHPAWRGGLKMILQQISEAALPAAARETVAGLLQASETELEATAEKILAGDPAAISPRDLPFVAAALQVYWVDLASSLGENIALARREQGGLCPVCGSCPMVGIVRSGGAEHGLRYLACPLCLSQWHLVRITCSRCASTNGIDYFTLEGSNCAVKAESCDSCNSYLKLLYLEKDSEMEAMADDLATLGLDMLMGKEGKTRRGQNLFFHPGRH